MIVPQSLPDLSTLKFQVSPTISVILAQLDVHSDAMRNTLDKKVEDKIFDNEVPARVAGTLTSWVHELEAEGALFKTAVIEWPALINPHLKGIDAYMRIQMRLKAKAFGIDLTRTEKIIMIGVFNPQERGWQ